MVYMVLSPIIIVALIIVVVVCWKQKSDCEKDKKSTKENLCLCGGPQMVGHCKPYSLFSDLGIGVNTPRANKGPPPLEMPYDVSKFGYRRIRPNC